MATQLPSTADVLLKLVQAQIMSFMVLPYECVPITAESDDEQIIVQAETLVYLRDEGGAFDMGQVYNAGRICTVQRLNLSATLWTRLHLDEVTRDDIQLTDSTIGHLKQRNALCDALLLFQPVDVSGNWLVSEPIKPVSTTRPRKIKGETGFVRSALNVVMPYQMTLTQSYQ